jgi:glycosyltransferase involved in cell wall biosynthesis
MKGKGVEYLEYSFNILYSQTYSNFEIVISDHSQSNDIELLCEKYSQMMRINYIKNKNKRGNSSANINNAIKNAKEDIIKILFQDDFLYDEYSLEKQIECFKNDWLVTAFCHYNCLDINKTLYPQYHYIIQHQHHCK